MTPSHPAWLRQARRLLARTLLPSLALLLGIPATGQPLEILYPANETAVRRSDYLIIDVAEALPLDGVTVTIGDVPSDFFDISGVEYRQQFGDILILLPEFDPGENRIMVEGFRQGEVVKQARATIYFLGLREEVPPEPYQLFVMHTPERQGKCDGCHHKFDYTPAQLDKPDVAQAACGGCHQRYLITADHVHGPSGAFECFVCHETAGQPSQFAVRAGDTELCVDCHGDQIDEFNAKKNVHGPIAAGSCLVCHDPHASANPGQILRPAAALCQECHQVKEQGHVVRGVSGKTHPLAGKPDPSREGRELDCVGCHNPHAGATPRYLQGDAASAMSLCQRCHKK